MICAFFGANVDRVILSLRGAYNGLFIHICGLNEVQTVNESVSEIIIIDSPAIMSIHDENRLRCIIITSLSYKTYYRRLIC